MPVQGRPRAIAATPWLDGPSEIVYGRDYGLSDSRTGGAERWTRPDVRVPRLRATTRCECHTGCASEPGSYRTDAPTGLQAPCNAPNDGTSDPRLLS